MPEVELKLRIPPGHVDAVHRAVKTSTATTRRLRATYFDTDGRALARHHIGLRQRLEGRQWVQTAKALGDDLITRLEHDAALPGAPLPGQQPDIGLHAADARISQVLAAALAEAGGPLVEQYRTDIQRTTRCVRMRGKPGRPGCLVELSLDLGHIEARGQRLTVAELEFECLQGPPGEMVALALRWAARFGLWLDPRSKAQRGDWLAQGRPAEPALRFEPLGAAMPEHGPHAFRAALHACLKPVLENLALLADGLGGEPPEASQTQARLHQVRVGLRRLRVLGRDLATWLPLAADPDLNEELQRWNTATTQCFRAFADAHDDGVLLALLEPVLGAAGVSWPMVDSPAHSADSRLQQATAAETQAWVLQSLKLGARLAEIGSEPGPQPKASTLAALSLQDQWRRWRRLARRWPELGEEGTHDLRKKAKRLRYSLALSRPFWAPAKADRQGRLGRFEAHLAAVQDALGNYTDLMMARDRVAQLRAGSADAIAQPDAQAWTYAAGWIAGRLEPARRACELPLAALLKTPLPWKRT